MRYLAIALAVVLYVLGWLAGWVHVALRWLWSALAVGWDDAHRQAAQPRRVDTTTRRDVAVPPWPAERPPEAA